MKSGILVLFIAFSIQLFSQDFKYTAKPVFEGVGNSSSISFDADNDGKTDLLISGKSGSSFYTRLYHNNGDSTFLDKGVPFTGLAYGSTDVLDYNNDGYLDIVLCGSNNINKYFFLYKNKGNNLFSEVSINIPGIDYSTVKCSDLNGDGWTDIIACGQTATQRMFKVYRNKGDGSFSEASSLEGMYDGSFIIADINKDSYPDIIASGVNNSFELISKVYLNKGKNDFSFKERLSGIEAIRGGKIDNLDFNNDGYTDILITGKTANDEYISRVYRNNSGESFTLFSSLTGLYYSTSATGDFSNDGFDDIILAGLDAGSVYKTLCYINDSGSGFTEHATVFANVTKGSITAFDLTNDNKLDILISGYKMAAPVAYVYNNMIPALNTRPLAPLNLTSYSNNDSVIIRWRKSSDAETNSEGLTYDFYIKKVTDGSDVFGLPADYSTGERRVFREGFLKDTFMIIRNMPYGKYIWSVQAIDNGKAGSPFSAEQEFNICHSFNLGRDTSICKGSFLPLTAGSSSDIVNWYSSANPSLPFHNGNSTTITSDESVKIWAVVNTPIGCTISDTINLSTLPLPLAGMKKDTAICVNSDISLTLDQSGCKGVWSSESGLISAVNTAGINFKVNHNDIVYVKITDLNGCINYDTTNIVANALPESILPADTSVCLKNTLILKAVNNTDSVYWSDDSGRILSNKNEYGLQAIRSEKLFIKLINDDKCISFDTISIFPWSLPVACAGRDSIICPGTSVILGKTVTNETLQYDWSPAYSLNNKNDAHPIASPAGTTEFILKITDSHSCVNYDSVKVIVNSPGIIDPGGDKYICKGESVVLGGDPVATGSLLPYSYMWYPESKLDDNNLANPAAAPDTTTQFYLVVSAGNCIIDTFSVKVNVWPLPVVTTSRDVIIGYKESTELQASGGIQYKWEPGTSLSYNTTSSPVATPEVTTTYTVLVNDINGCESSGKVTVIVQNEIFVPNLFTPNGDGKNDFFLIYGTGIDKIHLRIYSPEGIQVYETRDVLEATEKGWDGTSNGEQLNSGKYLWKLEATASDGKPLTYNGSSKGIITLLR